MYIYIIYWTCLHHSPSNTSSGGLPEVPDSWPSIPGHRLQGQATTYGYGGVLKWGYPKIYGDIPLHRPYIGLIYGRYLQSIGSWNGH